MTQTSTAAEQKDLLKPSGKNQKSDLQNGDVKDVKPDEDEIAEGGYGWLVCFASFWTNGTVFGTINTFGIFYQAMLKEYTTEKDSSDISFKTAWVGSVTIGMVFFMSPIVSIVTDRIGIRKTAFAGASLAFIGMLSSSFVKRLELLYLTYGLLLGIGSSFVYTPSLIILGHYFQRHLGIANGIVTFGSAVFTIVLPFALKEMLKLIGLSHTLQAMSSLYFILIFLTLLWKPVLKHKHSELNHLLSTESLVRAVGGCCRFIGKYLNMGIWRNRAYVIWVLSVGTALFGYFVPFVHLVKYTNENLPGSNPELLIMCIGGVSGVSRLAAGKLSDSPKINRIRLQQGSFAIMGILTTLIPLANAFWQLAIICVIMGLCDGTFVCLLGPIAFDIVGPRGASQAMGFLLGLLSIPMTAGPPIAGLLYDVMGSYNVAFHCAGAPPLIGAIIMFFIPKLVQHFPAVTHAEEEIIMSKLNLYGDDGKQDEFKLHSSGVWHRGELMDYIPPTRRRSSAAGHRQELLVLNSSLNLSNLVKPHEAVVQFDEHPATAVISNGHSSHQVEPLDENNENNSDEISERESVI
ncbi:monocarboxylate transporter 10-like [Tubulanus polymorphus]|uniref:monocarboxylate transporter 10-like n=1 Tax=Tubulanus polymorphus TaxID=672921 RepID=UPI003DA213FC